MCVICETRTTERLTKVTEVGLDTLRTSCEVRRRTGLLELLDRSTSEIYVHASCRKSFTRSSELKKLKLQLEQPDESVARSLRSGTSGFQWKTMCLFCARDVDADASVRQVLTIEFDRNVREKCVSRNNDDWSREVKGRVESCIDLVAEEAKYHIVCHSRFVNGLPKTRGEAACGRPEHSAAMQAFERMCYKLETSCERSLYTLQDLHKLMTELSGTDIDAELYSVKYTKFLLKERYGKRIDIAEVPGRGNVVCFHDLASLIISDKWASDRASVSSSRSERIVRDASRLIASEIREMTCTMAEYPAAGELSAENQDIIPPLLKLFIQSLVTSELKQLALAEALIQAARPQSCIMPLLFGLGVQLDHEFGSKFLLTQLSRLGFSISYDEVARYKMSVMQASSDNQQPHMSDTTTAGSSFTQFIGDNVDHNVRTLDGCNTFHGMGVIAASVTDGSSYSLHGGRIRRLTQRVKVADVCRDKVVEVVSYNLKSSTGLATVMLKNIRSLQSPTVLPPVTNLSLLWHMFGLLPAGDLPRPNWSGYMQTVCVGDHAPVASVTMLPIIDLKPTDESCIYSTLLFVMEQARKVNQSVPCITFDQPLYIKAVDIATAARLNIVCRLGGFHTLMNFLGAVGYIMQGSGLEEMMGLLYGSSTVDHVMTGKAFARAVRGHFIIHDALLQVLLQCIIDDVATDTDDDDAVSSIILHLYQFTWNNKVNVADCSILECEKLKEITDKLQLHQRELFSQSRTARLWLQYIEYIDLVKLFLLAERMSDWHLHLTACSRMLNLFAAAGHYNYAKSVRVYVQQMIDLPQSHPLLYNEFVSGRHSIRRSDRMWAGLSCDLVIEQTMMKSVKGRGGLTRGRGMHETVRHVWTSTMSNCASVHFAMSCLTGTDHDTSDHCEVRPARMNRDRNDLMKVKQYVADNSPFRFLDTDNLLSLSTGVIATPDDNVTCDDAEMVGLQLHQKWDSKVYSDVSVRKRDTVKTLAHMTNVCRVGKDQINIDVNKLFHRLIIVGQRSIDIVQFFRFELTQYPTSLFNNLFMRKPDKPALFRRVAADLSSDHFPRQCQYVVDGGCILHRVRWMRGVTCEHLTEQFVSYIRSKFGTGAVIVFDGYEDVPSTKDHEHKRRQSKVCKVAPTVNLEETKQIIFDQEQFLANSDNKAALIDMLVKAFCSAGIKTSQSVGDADVDIVSAAVELALSGQTVTVFCDDTDVLSMLVYHLSAHMSDIFFWSEGKKGKTGKCISVHSLQSKLGYDLCQHVLVLHALGGCDTTSAIYGFGKGTVLTRLGSNCCARTHVELMQDVHATHDEVKEAGLQLLVALFGGKPTDSLDSLRYSSYVRLVSTSLGSLRPEKLPPSERAAYYHLLRVHLQAVEWKMLSHGALIPTDWGWKCELNQYVPIMTDLPAAPDDILHVVRCGCKTGCGSALCTCRKNDLRCMSACKCNRYDCENSDRDLLTNEVSLDDYAADEVVADEDIDWVDEEVVEM